MVIVLSNNDKENSIIQLKEILNKFESLKLYTTVDCNGIHPKGYEENLYNYSTLYIDMFLQSTHMHVSDKTAMNIIIIHVLIVLVNCYHQKLFVLFNHMT